MGYCFLLEIMPGFDALKYIMFNDVYPGKWRNKLVWDIMDSNRLLLSNKKERTMYTWMNLTNMLNERN